MKLSIKSITTATLALLLSYSVTPTVALSQQIHYPLTDTLIVPGQRVGPVTRNTTRQDLVKIFGASHLVDKLLCI